MRISDFKDEDAIELLADLIEPAANILSDKAVQNAFNSDISKISMAKMILKDHKGDIMEILARLNGKEIGDYHCNPVSVLVDLMTVLNDKELMDFFAEQQALMNTGDAPLSAVVSTEEKEL